MFSRPTFSLAKFLVLQQHRGKHENVIVLKIQKYHMTIYHNLYKTLTMTLKIQNIYIILLRKTKAANRNNFLNDFM